MKKMIPVAVITIALLAPHVKGGEDAFAGASSNLSPIPRGERHSAASRVVFQACPATDARFVAAFQGEPGWEVPAVVTYPQNRMSTVSFTGDSLPLPAPLYAAAASNILVQTVMIAARGAASDLATLLDAQEPVALRVVNDGGSMHATNGNEKRVAATFVAERYRVLQLDFAGPFVLSDLFFGGAAGRPEWRCNWQGEIAEVVGFDQTPGADVLHGTANYLANRWNAGPHPASSAQRAAAKAAGLDIGDVWMTTIMVR